MAAAVCNDKQNRVKETRVVHLFTEVERFVLSVDVDQLHGRRFGTAVEKIQP